MNDTIFREYRPSDAERSDRSAGDRLRHREKVRESIRENIADIIAEESIIGKNKDRVIKVPLRGIKEYRFIYGDNAPGVGTGDGNAQPGQVVGKTGKDGQGKGRRPGRRQAWSRLLRDRCFARRTDRDHVRGSRTAESRAAHSARDSFRSIQQTEGLSPRRYPDPARQAAHGAPARHANHRDAAAACVTGTERIEVQIEDESEELLEGEELLEEGENGAEETPAIKRRFPFHQDDLRYKHLETDTREDSNAVVMCIMDTSGSMDTMKKYLARSFFFMLYQFISTRYRNVEIVFIGHHTEANEVTEEEFFHKGESGGTFISSGYQKALDIIDERYHPSLWNIYAFHCSDGDNFDSDNPAALRTAKELSELCNLFGYGEIKPLGSRYYESSMLNVFRRLDVPNFQAVLIERKEDIWPSFKAFLSKDRVKE